MKKNEVQLLTYFDDLLISVIAAPCVNDSRSYQPWDFVSLSQGNMRCNAVKVFEVLITFSFAMFCSLVNVVVYSVRDPKFRSNVADILVSYCPCCCGGDSIAALRVFSQRKQRLRSASSSFAPASPMTMSESSNKTAQRPSVSKA